MTETQKRTIDYDQHELVVKKVFRAPVFDENYPYINHSLPFRAARVLLHGLTQTIGFAFLKLVTGAKVYNREILKKYKAELKGGVITIANHVHFFDYICIMMAIRPHMQFYPAWTGNFVASYMPLIRLTGGIPIPKDPAAKEKFFAAMDWAMENGKWMHFNPEGSMWSYYDAIRPFKKGAFYLACKFKKPILPIAINYRKPQGIAKLFHKKPLLSIHIGRPVFETDDIDSLMTASRAALQELAGFERIIPQSEKNEIDTPAV